MRFRIETPIDNRTPPACIQAHGRIMDPEDYPLFYPPHGSHEGQSECHCTLVAINENNPDNLRGIVLVDGVEMKLTNEQTDTIQRMFTTNSRLNLITIKEFLGVSDDSYVEIRGWIFLGGSDHEK